jgi:hypothetical protein
MSAQGATLRKGNLHLPIWPVAVLVAGTAAFALVITLIDGGRPESSTSSTELQGPAVGISHVTPRGIEYVPAVDFPGPYGVPVAEAVGISHVTPRGIEYVPAVDFPGPYGVPAADPAPASTFRPNMSDGNMCGQCR